MAFKSPGAIPAIGGGVGTFGRGCGLRALAALEHKLAGKLRTSVADRE